jgi:hypothetical protein
MVGVDCLSVYRSELLMHLPVLLLSFLYICSEKGGDESPIYILAVSIASRVMDDNQKHKKSDLCLHYYSIYICLPPLAQCGSAHYEWCDSTQVMTITHTMGYSGIGIGYMAVSCSLGPPE